MKKNSKSLFIILLLALPAMTEAQFTYTTNADNTITITGYTGSGGAVTIPATINGLPVVSIGDYAFGNNGDSVTSVTIPNSVTSIGVGAFYDCRSLTNVIIGNGVISIGDEAFYYCDSLQRVTIGDGVRSIGYYAFGDCTALGQIFFSGNAPNADSTAFAGYPSNYYINDPARVYYLPGTTGWSSTFANLPTLLLDQPSQCGYTVTNNSVMIVSYVGSGGTVSIPAIIGSLPVTSIGVYAFGGTALTNVTIPDSVTSIGESAFSGSALTSVTIPDSVTTIGDEAFYVCSRLTNVTIGDSVITIGDSAFGNCSSLMSLTISDSVTNIGDYAFEYCQNLTTITVAAQNLFYSSDGGVLFDKNQTVLIQYPIGNPTTNYAIPNGVTTIGDWAFVGGISLTSVTIPDSVTNIGNDTFVGTGLTSVTIPDSVNSIGIEAFGGCGNLIGIYFTGNAPTVDSTPSTPFGEDDNLKMVYYLANTTGWSNTFGGLPTVMLAGPPQFGTTFDGWKYVTDQIEYTLVTGYVSSSNAIVIPSLINGLPVTGIAPYAFFDNSSLANVTIPNNVTSIGDSAFQNCYDLKSVTFGNGLASIGDEAFYNCNLNSVTIPSSVTNIGGSAFFNCALTNVFFAGNAPDVGGEAFFVYIVNKTDGFSAVPDRATIYYLPGTLGWSNTFASRPTALWLPKMQTGDGSFGVKNNQFGFNIGWASGQTVVVEACTNLFNPVWIPVRTNTLVGGASYFSDPQPANLPGRYYRLRSP